MPKHNMPYCDESTNPGNGWRTPEPKPEFAGYHRYPLKPEVGHMGGSFEVFYVNVEHVQHSAEPTQVGWYWWSCFPGCLPDSDPCGPFPTAEGAYLDAIGD